MKVKLHPQADYVLGLLVAAGHITQEKACQARDLAITFGSHFDLDLSAPKTWRSVEESEPKPGLQVMFLVRGKFFCVGKKVDRDSTEWIDELSVDRDGDPTSAFEVTHWMHLPKVPAAPPKPSTYDAAAHAAAYAGL